MVVIALLLVVGVAAPVSNAYASRPTAQLLSSMQSVPLAITADNPERPPYNLAARAISNTEIRVTWNNSSYIDGFRLYRWNGSSWQLIRERFTNTWYDDKNLSPGVTYYYSVCSYYGGKTLCADGYTSAAPSSAAPAAPNALWTTTRSSTAIRFGWNQPCWSQPCIPVKSFRVYRQRGGTSTFELIITTFGDMRTWDDTGLSPNTEYYYTVCADSDSGSTCAANWQRGKTY
jgi:fibronectin type 3 domain-containing protein